MSKTEHPEGDNGEVGDWEAEMAGKAVNFRDLAEPIHYDGVNAYWNCVVAVLDWLDEHAEQAPGPTITESELKGVNEWLPDTAQIDSPTRRDVAEFFGVTVVPDPAPTNAEKLEQLHDNWSTSNRNPPFGEWADSVGVKAPEDWGNE